MDYFKSTQVKVFPCGNRGQISGGTDVYNPESRLQTEFNYIHAGNRIKGKASYIINANTNYIECVIGGYYFYITLTSTDITNLKNKFLCIKVTNDVEISSSDTTSILASFEGDEILDNTDGYFTGLGISDSESGTAYLKIFDSDGNVIEVNKTQIKLSNISGNDENGKENLLAVGNIDESTTDTIKQRIDSIENGIVKQGLELEVENVKVDIKY